MTTALTTCPSAPPSGLIEVGMAPEWGFTAENWLAGSYLWRKDDVVLLSFVAARNPGTGALGRLVRAIEADGFTVEGPTPFPRMKAILEHWGFKPRIVFDEDMQDNVEVWSRE